MTRRDLSLPGRPLSHGHARPPPGAAGPTPVRAGTPFSPAPSRGAGAEASAPVAVVAAAAAAFPAYLFNDPRSARCPTGRLNTPAALGQAGRRLAR